MVRTLIPQPHHEAEHVLLARRMFIGGCFGLPWLWAINVWYFWGKVFGQAEAQERNEELARCE